MGKAEVPFHTLFMMMRLYALKGSLYENSLNPIWRFVAQLHYLSGPSPDLESRANFEWFVVFSFPVSFYNGSIKYTAGPIWV